MNVAIRYDGSLCVGDVAFLYACCPSDADVIWTIESGAENVQQLPASVGAVLGHPDSLALRILKEGGFKIKAECCKPYESPYIDSPSNF